MSILSSSLERAADSRALIGAAGPCGPAGAAVRVPLRGVSAFSGLAVSSAFSSGSPPRGAEAAGSERIDQASDADFVVDHGVEPVRVDQAKRHEVAQERERRDDRRIQSIALAPRSTATAAEASAAWRRGDELKQ